MKNHKFKLATLLFTLILVLSVAPIYANNSTDPQWPQSSYNSEQNGQSPYTGPQNKPKVDWNYTLESDVPIEPGTAPVVDSEGTAYFTGAYHTQDPQDFKTYVYAINPNGTQKFNVTFAQWLGGISIGPNGTLYVPGHFYTNTQYLFALNSDGTPKWNFSVADVWNLMDPIVTSDGTIYTGTYQAENRPIPTHGIYWALNPDGTEKWEFYIGIDEIGPKSPNSLLGYAVDSNGVSYLSFSHGANMLGLETELSSRVAVLYALDIDGNKKWNLTLDIPEFVGWSKFSPVVGPSGMIYAILSVGYPAEGSTAESTDEEQPMVNKNYVVAVNPDGTQAWRYDVPGEAFSSEKSTTSLAVANDGTIYFGTLVGGYFVGNGTLFALNPDGTQKWNYTSPNDLPFCTPIIASDGTIYTGNAVPFYGGDGEGKAAGEPEENIPIAPISKLFAFNPDGTIKWTLDNIICSFPAALTKDGTMYLSSLLPGNEPPPPPPEGGAAGEPISSPYAFTPPRTVLYNFKDAVSDLYLQVTSSNTNPTIGQLITLTFKVGNKAQDSAMGTVFKWVLPAGLEIVGKPWSDTIIQPVYDPTTRTITWDLGTVPYGDPYMWVNTRILSSGNLIIQATLNTLTNDPDLEQNIQILTISAQSINQQSNTVNSVSAQTSTNTIPMQKTGAPLAYIFLAMIVVLGGILSRKRK